MKITEPTAHGAFISIVAFQDDSKHFEVSVPKEQMSYFSAIMNRNKLIRTHTCKEGVYHVELK